MKKDSIKNIGISGFKNFSALVVISTIVLRNPIAKANQIANSAIDLKKEVKEIKQKILKIRII